MKYSAGRASRGDRNYARKGPDGPGYKTPSLKSAGAPLTVSTRAARAVIGADDEAEVEANGPVAFR